jgi:peptide/nickel transport system substrate-binding protein
MKHLKTCLLGSALAAAAMLSPVQAQEKAVTIVLSEELDVVDPCMASRSNIGRVVLQNISETLTELDSGGGGLKPRLAASWEVVDGDTWRFKLQPGVKFTDGTDFDAEDVVYSLTRTISKDITCEIGAKFFGAMKLTTNVVDPTTLEITSEPPQPILPLLMSTLTIVPTGTDPKAFVKVPVGTGPYVFSEWNAGQNIVLTRNENYWGKKPEVEKANYIFRPDMNVAAAMVAAGEADIVPSIAVQDATNPKTDFSYLNSETFFMRIDAQVAPLNDRRIREALNLAIDRQAFKGTILSKDVLDATQIVPPSTIGWNGDLKVWPFDIEKAKALVAEAKAAGVPVDKEIKIIGRINNFPNGTETLEAMLAMLKETGLNVTLTMYEVKEWEDFYSKPFAEDRPAQLIQVQHDNNKGDPVFSMYFKYHSGGLQSILNDPKVDGLIEQATGATGEERAKLWKEALRIVNDEIIADMPMFHMVGYTRVSERLNFTPTIATNSELQLSQIGFK